MIEALIKLLQSGKWISEAAWNQIIRHADRETLIWLKANIRDMKYFVRDELHGPKVADRLLKAIEKRLNPEDLSWVKELIP